MGIHDRGYYRDEPGGVGGGTRYRFRGLSAWSVTTWLIVINCAVFAFDAFMSQSGLPVYSGDRAFVQQLPPPRDRVTDPQFVTLDRFNRPTPVEARQVGTAVFRLVYDKATRQVIGAEEYHVRPPLEALGHFSTFRGFAKLEVWRLVSFQFLHDHGTIWHLGFNMLGLYMFGTIVEEQLGRRKYLAFYLVCGIFGGLSYLLLNLLGRVLHVQLPGVLFADVRTPLIGASAGVFGVIMACAKIAPDMPVYLMFLPIPLRMRWLAYGWVGLAAFNVLFGQRLGQGNQGGDAAHLGGAIAGAYFIRHSHLLMDFFDVFGDSRKERRPGKPRRGDPRPEKRGKAEAQLDAILDKVRAHGLQSLSAGEKRILRRDTERRRRGSGG